MQAGVTAGSVSDPYTARTARERARTAPQRLVTLACNCSDYTIHDRSDSSPTTHGVGYCAAAAGYSVYGAVNKDEVAVSRGILPLSVAERGAA